VAIVGGFDVHRAQITFDYLDTESGEVTAGQIRPAARPTLRTWLQRFAGRADVAFAVEGCTGWRFVVEELGKGLRPLKSPETKKREQNSRFRRDKNLRSFWAASQKEWPLTGQACLSSLHDGRVERAANRPVGWDLRLR
jgi:hypothetical protein